MKEYSSKSPEETEDIGSNFGNMISSPCLICLSGELGSGKTTFVKGLAQGLGIEDQVTSPSYTIMREYKGKETLHHIDLFRIQGGNEFIEAGLEDFLIPENEIVAIEWSERIQNLLPKERYEINLEIEDRSVRRIRIKSVS